MSLVISVAAWLWSELLWMTDVRGVVYILFGDWLDYFSDGRPPEDL